MRRDVHHGLLCGKTCWIQDNLHAAVPDLPLSVSGRNKPAEMSLRSTVQISGFVKHQYFSFCFGSNVCGYLHAYISNQVSISCND